jgi:CRISPR-associated protein Csd2
MKTLNSKIDFILVFRVRNANPNGDPLNGNCPRTDYNGFGEVTDVCLKRKLRDRLLESGQKIFVQSDDRKTDDAESLKARAEKTLGSKLGSSELVAESCKTWFDVRAFGQLFAFAAKKVKKGEDQDSGISVGIRGPVSIHSAVSVEPIRITSTQITKSVNGDGDGKKRGSDTMGMKHRVGEGVYVMRGSMNPQLAERTGFSDTDAEVIKKILPKMFENDASSSRPEGSMEVLKVVWFEHNCKAGQYSSAKVHQSVMARPNGEVDISELTGLKPEVISGF